GAFTMTTRWYVARDKKKVGPLSPEELTDLIRSGQVQAQDMVLQEGAKGWVPVSRATELLAVGPIAPPPPPPPPPPAPVRREAPSSAPAVEELQLSPADEPAPAAASESSAETRPPWSRRALAEIRTTTQVTWTGARQLVHWVQSAWRRWRTRRELA